MKKLFFISLLFLSAFFFNANSQVNITVGTGTIDAQYNPVYTFYGYNYTQQIYTAAELTAAGASTGMQINAIRFYWKGAGSLNNTNVWSVYMGTTNQSNFTSNSSWVPFASLTNVYTGNVTLPGTAGWFTITLTTPIIWTGNNIVVAIDENVASYGESTTRWQGSITPDSKSIYYYSDGTNPDPASPPNATNTTTTRPNIQFSMVSLTPCAGEPDAGTATISNNIGCIGATFTLSSTGASIGGGITYQWQTAPDPSGPWTDVPGGANITANASTTSNAYYRLRVHCANSGLWASSNVVSYSVEGDACLCGNYPQIYSTYTSDEDISNVTIGSWSNSSTCATIAPGPGSIQNRYSNYVGFVTGPTLMQGETVNFSLTQTSCGTGSYNNGFQMYIDWNMDGDFLDAGEQVYNQSTAATGNHTKTGTFTVPITALPGVTRLRIVTTETTFPTTTNYAQTAYSWGETEDYCITIVAASNCTGTPNSGTANISSAIGCVGANFTLSSTGVTIANGITYQWQSATSASGPWTNISGATSSSFSTSTTVNMFYHLVVTCTNSGETVTSNTVSYSVEGDACSCGNYPQIFASSTGDEDISNVTIGSWSNSSTCATIAPGPGSIQNRYSNYVGFVTGPTLMQGETVNFSLTQTSCGTGSYNNGFQMYIDWNMDGDFLDAGEQVYNQPTAATGNHTKTGTFTVPITALPGVTRLRIVTTETTFPTTTNYAQTSYSYGETEDYCITIVAAAPCSGTPTAGNANPSTQQIATGNTATISLNGYTVASGITFQWQSSSSASGPWTNISGATSVSYTTPVLTTTTFYRCIVTCTNSSETATSTNAQVVIVPSFNMSTTTVTTCSSMFFDSGGATGNYGPNENYTLTVMPATTGNKVRVTFNSFNIENSYENLKIYNGSTVAAPLVGQYTGATMPPQITSTATNGALTFVFTSDGSAQYAGWEAAISCFNPCVFETPTFTQAGPYCLGWNIPELPTTSNNGYTGTWSPALNNTATTTYTFTPNDGECAYSTTMTITINPNNPASFTQFPSYCRGAAIPDLPTTSNDGIQGTWSPSINNQNTTEYIFTANAGVCAWTTMQIQIDTVQSGITNNSGSNELTCSLTHISLTATGGNNYSWNGGQTSPLASIVVSNPGIYSVIVHGTNGCTASESITITQNNAAPTVSFTNNTGTSELNCHIDEISITASGGVSYAWNGGSSPNTATNTFSNPGTYFVTVTGSNDCFSIESYETTESNPLDITSNITPPSCFGMSGSVQLTVNSGGLAPYSIEWEDASVSFNHNSVPSNTNFSYTITDADNCETVRTVMVTSPELLQINFIGTNASCYNSNDASINASTSQGGVTPYSYIWSIGRLTPTISNITAGTYMLTLTDNNNCTTSASYTVSQPDEIIIDLEIVDAICGQTSGSINASTSGGAGGFSYSWSNGSISNNIFALVPGTYVLTVTDANHCTKSISTNINKTGNIIANISVIQPILCAGAPEGVLQGSSVNGAMPWSFKWSNGATSETISQLPAGTYKLTLTDDWGCTGIAEQTLSMPVEILITSSVSHLKCNGSNDGKINISINSGEPPFQVLWSNGSSGLNLNNLLSGQYTVTITDNRNCAIFETYVLNEPAPINLGFAKKDVSCYGQMDGSIIMNVSGGSEPYSYTLKTPKNQTVANTAIVNALAIGDYIMQVVDNNGCKESKEISIYQPAKLTASISSSNPSCIGNNDGYIFVTPFGGSSPYIFKYDNFEVDTNVYANLKEGRYHIEIQDVNGCEYTIGDVIINDGILQCLDIPNAFSPNGDGINETWIIKNIELYKDAQIQVFNRWGQEMYYGKYNSEPWDGTFNGKKLPAGAYLYIINTHNDEAENYKGTVSIIY